MSELVSKQEVLDVINKRRHSDDFCRDHHIDRAINLNVANIVINELKPVNALLISEVIEELKDIKAEVEEMYGVTDARGCRLMIDKYEVLKAIDRKIAEVKSGKFE